MRVQTLPMMVQQYGTITVGAKQHQQMSKIEGDSVEISQESRNIISQKGASCYPDDYFPEGFPEDVKQKMVDLKKSGNVSPIAMAMLEMTLIGIPKLEYAYNKYGTCSGDLDLSDIYTKGGYNLYKHIERMVTDKEKQVSCGEGGNLNKELLSLLKSFL